MKARLMLERDHIIKRNIQTKCEVMLLMCEYKHVNKMEENTPLNMNIEEEMEMDIREVEAIKTRLKKFKILPLHKFSING